jgi:hypothetical protein
MPDLPAAREELKKLVQNLGIRIGPTFREGRRNNRSAAGGRKVQRLG